MKKRGMAILLVACVLFLSFLNIASAAVTESAAVDSAYSYLISQVDGKWSALDSQTASLALLALSYDDRISGDGTASLIAKKHLTSACWPAASCNVKDTALAVFALSRLGVDVQDSTDWLTSQQKAVSSSKISWYLQIDSVDSLNPELNCTVSYEGSSGAQVSDSIEINKDRTYSISSSQCLQRDSSLQVGLQPYWLRIKSTSGCLEKVFSVTCDKDAMVSLPYRKDSTWYVQPQTSPTPATISINTVCMVDSGKLTCNYEGTMWAAYVLMKIGKDYSQLVPYLIEQSADNKGILPDALLYSVSANEDHALALISQQSRDGYWTDVGGYGKYWDTALASMALADYAPDNVTKAKSWLVKNQNSDFSWGTYKIRDTAFMLFSAWPKTVSIPIGDCVSAGGSCRASCESGETESAALSCLAGGVCCQPSAGACTTIVDCFDPECIGATVTDSTGKKGVCENPETTCNDNFDNDGNGLTDMNDNACQKFCSDLAGTECLSDEACSGEMRKTLETDRCCLGSCEKSTNTCSEQAGSLCSADKCSGSVIASSDSTSTQICCSQKCNAGISITTWIVIIVLLAVLGAGIYYLNKKHYLDRFKGMIKFKKKPSAPPSGQQITFQPPVRPFYPQGRMIERKIPTATEKELEETVKKLKGFSEK